MGWTHHLKTRHHLSDRDLSEAARDSLRLADLHVWHHDEMGHQLDHAHDWEGQLIEGRQAVR
jgi:hypothetical protein